MRFKLPEKGDTRVRTKFLFFPVYDKNIKKYRWLEFARVKEVYTVSLGYEDVYRYWHLDRFLDTE